MAFVLDASATLAWLFEDELADSHGAALSALRALAEDRAVVPTIWALEVANGLRDGERRGRATRAEVTLFTDRLNALPVVMDAVPPSHIFGSVLELARDLNLTVYDATYLDLAKREQLPLATLDRALERAAREAGVELLA